MNTEYMIGLMIDRNPDKLAIIDEAATMMLQIEEQHAIDRTRTRMSKTQSRISRRINHKKTRPDDEVATMGEEALSNSGHYFKSSQARTNIDPPDVFKRSAPRAFDSNGNRV